MGVFSLKTLLFACFLLGAADAGTVEKEGLTITTSERWLATVAHGGDCMAISCSYDMDAASQATGHKVESIAIMRFNENTASFNREVEKIDIGSRQPSNANPGYKATSSKLTDTQAELSVGVAGQKICQFSTFQCVVKFTDVVSGNGKLFEKQTIRIASQDVLQFTQISTNKAWLAKVTDFITEQVSAMNKRMTNNLATLTARVDGLQETFDRRIAALNQELENGVNAAKDQISQSSITINNNVGALKAQTEAKIGTLETDLAAAIDNIQSNADGKIANVESDLADRIKDVKDNVGTRFHSLGTESSSRLAGFESVASSVIAGIQTDMDNVKVDTQANIDNLSRQVLSSLQSLVGVIESRTAKQLDSSNVNTKQVKDSFSSQFKSNKKVLTNDVSQVDGKVGALRTAVDAGLTRLQVDTARTTKDLEDHVRDGATTLETILRGRVESSANELSGQVEALGNAASTGNTALSDNLSALERVVLDNVNNLEISTQQQILALNSHLNSTHEETKSKLTTHIAQLDNAVVQVTGNLQSQVVEAKDETSKRLSELRDAAKSGITTVQNDVVQRLSDLQNNAAASVQQVSTDLSGSADKHDDAVNEKVTELQTNIESKITEVANILSKIVGSFSANQDTTIATINGEFSYRLNELEGRVSNLTQKTTDALEDSYNTIDAGIQQVVTVITPVINDVKTSTEKRLGDFEDDTQTSLAAMQNNLQKKISSAQTSTTTETANIVNRIVDQSTGVKAENTKTSDKINELVTLGKNIQQDIQNLDSKFDATSAFYNTLDAKLTNVDKKFTKLETENLASFQDIRETVGDISQNFSMSISSIGNGLTFLGQKRSEGHDGFTRHINDLDVYLKRTSVSLYNEMSQNFNILDDIIDSSDQTLREYLRPEHCVEGMGFTASSSLEYVVIPVTKNNPYEILCDARTEHGGWIMIQRRRSGNTNFYRDWSHYKEGFGKITEDFWLGLERIHQLTKNDEYELRVDLHFSGLHKFAKYSTFSIGDEESHYKMNLGGYTGTAGDSMKDTNGMGFSTHDNDNDKSDGTNCAITSVGGWWYNNCQLSNLNGVWGRTSFQGPRWNSFTRTSPVVVSEMKIRLKHPAVLDA